MVLCLKARESRLLPDFQSTLYTQHIYNLQYKFINLLWEVFLFLKLLLKYKFYKYFLNKICYLSKIFEKNKSLLIKNKKAFYRKYNYLNFEISGHKDFVVSFLKFSIKSFAEE